MGNVYPHNIWVDAFPVPSIIIGGSLASVKRDLWGTSKFYSTALRMSTTDVYPHNIWVDAFPVPSIINGGGHMPV